MIYQSILVNIDLDGPVAPIVTLAADMARRCKAKLVGFCAANAPMATLLSPEGDVLTYDIWQQMRREIEQKLQELHSGFRAVAGSAVRAEWRYAMGNPTSCLASVARVADLIITNAPQGAASGDEYHSIDPGSLIMQAGRPVLISANGSESCLAKKVVISWKDARESRRAVSDAVPLLAEASEVTIATVADTLRDEAVESLKDVGEFLRHHGIKSRHEVLTGEDAGMRLIELTRTMRADVVVSGAYGHSRLREWVFGGVTRTLLDETELHRFMSS